MIVSKCAGALSCANQNPFVGKKGWTELILNLLIISPILEP